MTLARFDSATGADGVTNSYDSLGQLTGWTTAMYGQGRATPRSSAELHHQPGHTTDEVYELDGFRGIGLRAAPSEMRLADRTGQLKVTRVTPPIRLPCGPNAKLQPIAVAREAARTGRRGIDRGRPSGTAATRPPARIRLRALVFEGIHNVKLCRTRGGMTREAAIIARHKEFVNILVSSVRVVHPLPWWVYPRAQDVPLQGADLLADAGAVPADGSRRV